MGKIKITLTFLFSPREIILPLDLYSIILKCVCICSRHLLLLKSQKHFSCHSEGGKMGRESCAELPSGYFKGIGRAQGVLKLDWAADIPCEGFVRPKTQTLGKVQMYTYCVLVRFCWLQKRVTPRWRTQTYS